MLNREPYQFAPDISTRWPMSQSFELGGQNSSIYKERIKVLGNMAQGQGASLTTAFWRNVTRESLLLFFTAIFYVGN